MKLSIRDLDLKGKRVLIRVDFNVPLDKTTGAITDDTRIKSALPTIEYALNQGAKVILMSHLGRPKGKKVPEMSLRPAAQRLGELLGKPVGFVEDCIGDEVVNRVRALKEGECLLLENLRFHPQEEANEEGFSKELASLGDVYVNDAFGTAHRAHASTFGVTRFFDQCAAGFLMEKELQYLGKALESPEHPFVALLGGAKISRKIEVINNLLDKVDSLLIGGGMAYTFFKAQGYEIGKSLLEEDKVDLAKDLIQKAGAKLKLPVDCLIADGISEKANTKIVPKQEIPPDWQGVDIGPETVAQFSEVIRGAKTVVWNGPMGVFEIDPFAKGTFEIAKVLAEITRKGATTIVGGGDTVAAVKKAGLEAQIGHVSTGGGASLELLGGKKLPGVEALTQKES